MPRLYNCKKIVIKPPCNFIKCNCSEEYKETVLIDGCLTDEIKTLWNKGVKTTGCCCGHGRELGYIGVTDDCIHKMYELGYQNYIFPDAFGGTERKDAFIPKTYGHIYTGYSSGFRG